MRGAENRGGQEELAEGGIAKEKESPLVSTSKQQEKDRNPDRKREKGAQESSPGEERLRRAAEQQG